MISRRFLAAGPVLLLLAAGIAEGKSPATSSDEQPGPTSPQGGSLATNRSPAGPARGITPRRRGFSDELPSSTSPQGGSLATNTAPAPLARATPPRQRRAGSSDEQPGSTSPQGGSMLPSSR